MCDRDRTGGCRPLRTPATGSRGQASVLIVGVLCAALVGTVVLGSIARGLDAHARTQRTADLAAVAGGRAMLDAYPRLFDSGPAGLSKPAYLAIGRAAAIDVAARNGGGRGQARRVEVSFPDAGTIAPVRVRVRVVDRMEVRRGKTRRGATATATAEAELVPDPVSATEGWATGGGYDGPLAHRQGEPMRPDVARAFDRMAAAARADGIALVITSAYRSDAEQAVLWARNPDPRWVAPPGRSLHRLGTELDLGPPAAYGWLRANAGRFGFLQRYAWEPWHYGYALNARSSPRAGAAADGRGADTRRSLPAFVPEAFAAPLARAAQRWNVSATLLAAQLQAESNFNPYAVSRTGARGIAQFMPATAQQYGLGNPFDAPAAIDAQARLMRDLLRRFAAVPLALAAYNAGPAPVAACMCVPPYPETRGYVARILGLMGGAGETGAGGLAVRLVR